MGCLFYTLSVIFSAFASITFIWIILEIVKIVFYTGSFNWTSVTFFVASILLMMISFVLGVVTNEKL